MRNETTSAAIKLLVFTAFSIAVVLTIAATIRPLGGGQERRSYSALFTSASRLAPGDDVRVGGVEVGQVQQVRLTQDHLAEVTFAVERDLALSTGTRAEIRFLNLVGDRYLALDDDGTSTSPQEQGTPIPLDRTTPALDLNDLLNGFKPLFAALEPADVNALSLDIVRTLQGDGGTVQALIAHTAGLTSELADRDELIGSVITNLDQTAGLVADRHLELERLVTDLRVFVGDLADDRATVGRAIESIDTMTDLSSDLVAEVRPDLDADIEHLREIATTLGEPENLARIDDTVQTVPTKLERMVRIGSYGSWFNFYLCSITFKVGTDTGLDDVLAAVLADVELVDTTPRCAR